MGELRYSLIKDETELSGFNCGNKSVNALVANSFYRHKLRQSLTYKVSINGYRMGFYAVSICEISLEDTDTPMADCFDRDHFYGAVRLDYIAVDVNAQKRGLGTKMLTYIISGAHHLYNEWPVRFLVLDALREKVDWYMRNGFDVFNKADLRGNSETVGMFLDLMPKNDSAELDEYSSSFYS